MYYFNVVVLHDCLQSQRHCLPILFVCLCAFQLVISIEVVEEGVMLP